MTVYVNGISPDLETLKTNDDALQSIQLEHRLGRSLDDSFNCRIYGFDGIPTSHRANTDDYWTDAGLVIPAGPAVDCGASIYSRKVFKYPILQVTTKLPTIEAGKFWFIGLEAGASYATGIACIYSEGTEIRIFFGTKEDDNRLNITDLLPANYDTLAASYLLKLNKQSFEFFRNGYLRTVGLIGVPESIPNWENNEPYTLGSVRSNIAAELPVFLEIFKVSGGVTFPLLDITKQNNLVALDGDPLSPRQYALYNENTETKWNGLVLSGAGDVKYSHPVPIWGYPGKSLYFQANGAGTLIVQFYIGGGWRTAKTVAIEADVLDIQVIDSETPIMRCQFTPDAYPATITCAEVYVS